MTKSRLLGAICAFALCGAVPAIAQSATIDFNFTGNLVVADPTGGIIYNGSSPLTPISAELTYNTDTGIGGSDLSIVLSDSGFWDQPATFHDISLMHDAGTNTIRGSILVDWNGNFNMPMNIDWDATGFFNAINQGLNVGDTISGTTLKQDTNNDGSFDTFTDVFSANPYSDALLSTAGWSPLEGPAPLAATSASLGLGYDIDGNYIGGTLFDGIRGLINIGSGNSLIVTSISAVPIPPALWLFGSGLLGLIGISRRNKAA
jgi:hypothetical protein